MKKSIAINQLLRNLFPLPRSLRIKKNISEYRRALALTVILLTISATVWFWTAVLSALYIFFNFHILANVCYGVIVSIVLCFQVWGFYHFGNTRLTSMLLTLTYFLMALSLVLMSGGYHSASMAILLSSPVISFRAGGKDEGIMNSIFVGLTGLALAIVDMLDIKIINLLVGLDQRIIFSISWAVTLAVIAVCLVTYDLDE